MRLEADIEVGRGDFRLSCQVAFGRGVHLISGPIGSGKSTMASALASLIGYEGRITKEGIGSATMSLQFPEYHVTAASVRDEVLSWGLDPRDVIGRAGLEGREDTDPFKLSRGQLKRLNLTCMLSLEPDLLLLDEPFSSLDCRVKALICESIEAREGITLVFTHERSVLPRVDTISHIEDGVLEHHGAVPDAIYRWRSPPPYLRRTLDADVLPKNIRLEDCMEALCATRG